MTIRYFVRARNASSQISNHFIVVGIGVDIVDIPRLAQALTAPGERFCRRVFTAGEIAYCEQFTNRAERYAAKEAARKALGAATPLKWLAWREVEIISSTVGAPHLQFYGCAAALLPAAAHHARAHLAIARATADHCFCCFGDHLNSTLSIRPLLQAAYCSRCAGMVE